MPSFALLTVSEDFVRIRGTNATDNGFPSRIPTLTEPTGLGDSAAQATASAVLNLRNNTGSGAGGPNRVIVVPFGVGSDTNTFSFRVIGWRRARARSGDGTAPASNRLLWVPIVLGEFSATLSLQVGVADSLISASNRFCDTIALTGTTANDDVSIDLVSPANDTTGHVVLDVKGFEKLEITFTTGGSATSCNALVAKY
jgi:hypothetical protein